MWAFLLLLACGAETTVDVVEAEVPNEPAVVPPSRVNPVQSYEKAQSDLEETRRDLAQRSRDSTLRARAREALVDGVHDQLIPHWIGTEWDFYGTSQTPGTGEIACGYFVSTVLRDAGLKVERVKMAQQASEYIVETFAEPGQIRRFRKGDEDAVVNALLAEPEGLYVVGLDFHTGFLVHRDGAVQFCHSTFVDQAGVLCEDPRTSPAFTSNYHVFGPVMSDGVVDAWLDGDALATVTK